MKKNLEELQAKMKARMQNALLPQVNTVNTSLVNSNSSVESPSHVNAIVGASNPPPLCSHCKHRVCRKGSSLCSRCTGKSIQQELRSTLPGLEVKRDIIPLRQVKQEEVVFPTATILQDAQGKHYSRKEVATLLGVSPTSICRWEQKGKTQLPVKLMRTGQLIYTEEHLAKLKEFMSQVEIVHYEQKPDNPENQQEKAAKIVTKKVFKINKGIERAVASRLGRLSCPLGKLL